MHHNNMSQVQPAFWFERERKTGSDCRPKSGDLASSLPTAQLRIMSSRPNHSFYLGSRIGVRTAESRDRVFVRRLEQDNCVIRKVVSRQLANANDN
jgi:hypothetical protein